MKYIELEELLEIHALLIDKFGGASGVRDVGRLEAAIATQRQAVFGQEVYPSLWNKAAAMMRGIIADHPFYDGNKRTGALVALTFLECNGQFFVAKEGELEDFAVKVATGHLDVETIADWLVTYTVRRQ